MICGFLASRHASMVFDCPLQIGSVYAASMLVPIPSNNDWVSIEIYDQGLQYSHQCRQGAVAVRHHDEQLHRSNVKPHIDVLHVGEFQGQRCKADASCSLGLGRRIWTFPASPGVSSLLVARP